MSKIVLDVSVSLDGFSAGPNVRQDEPMGDGGERLLDEVWIHLVPLLLGAGTRLFDGEQAELIPEGEPVAGVATHLRYRVA